MKVTGYEEIELGKMRVQFEDGSFRTICRGDDYSDLDQADHDFLLLALLPNDIEAYRASLNPISEPSELPPDNEQLSPLEKIAVGLTNTQRDDLT